MRGWLALLGLVSLLVLTPGSAAQSPAQSGEAVYEDSVGEVESSLIPDITSVTVSHDADGFVTMVIRILNAPEPDPIKMLVIDIDANELTCEPDHGFDIDPYGTDFSFAYKGGSKGDSLPYVRFSSKEPLKDYPDTSCTSTFIPPGAATFSWGGGVVTLRFDSRLLRGKTFEDYAPYLGGGRYHYNDLQPQLNFSFRVVSWVKEVWGDKAWRPHDYAPDAGYWRYETSPFRAIKVGDFKIEPRPAQPGKLLRASLVAIQDNTGEPLNQFKLVDENYYSRVLVRCRAEIRAKTLKKPLRLRVREMRMDEEEMGRARCAWQVPAKPPKGGKIAGTITVFLNGSEVTPAIKTFLVPVNR